MKEVTSIMKRQHKRACGCGMMAAVLGLALTFAGLTGTSLAQENSAQMTVQPPSSDLIIKEGGDDVEVSILASDVHNLAAFQFTLKYNSSILKYVSVKEGAFLGSSGREVECLDPRVANSGKQETLQYNCVTLGPPKSLGGKAGADGSGTLVVVTLSPKGGGTTSLDLSDAMLIAAEIDAEGMPVQIATSVQGASLDVKGSSGFPWLVIGSSVGALVVIGAIGGGVLLLRRRSGGAPPSS